MEISTEAQIIQLSVVWIENDSSKLFYVTVNWNVSAQSSHHYDTWSYFSHVICHLIRLITVFCHERPYPPLHKHVFWYVQTQLDAICTVWAARNMCKIPMEQDRPLEMKKYHHETVWVCLHAIQGCPTIIHPLSLKIVSNQI